MSKIIIRDFSFDIEAEADQVHSYAVNEKVTRLLNALSLLFPVGERFFIESIRAYRDEVSPELKEEINLFIRQEGQHGREHLKINRNLGIDLSGPDSEALFLLNKYGYDKEHALLATVCLERYTGLMGIILPPFAKFIFKDNEISRMWHLHAIEELEHVSVGEKVMKEHCNFGLLKQAKYMALGAINLTRQTYRNYKRLERAA